MTATATRSADADPPVRRVAAGAAARRARAVHRRWPGRLAAIGLDFTGLAVAVCFFCLSLTPSLLPRPWYLQGVITGILTATGYTVGVMAGWTVRRAARRSVSHPAGPVARRRAWRVLWSVGPVLMLAFLIQAARWQ